MKTMNELQFMAVHKNLDSHSGSIILIKIDKTDSYLVNLAKTKNPEPRKLRYYSSSA